MDELTERKRIILRAVVLEYVATAEPIASERIATRYGLGVRSATVRNELAEMSDLGYLEQPHTSAGRIPSDTGYRYYVNFMLSPASPDQKDQQKVLETAQGREVLRTILMETTKLMSRMTHQLTAATILANSSLKVGNCLLSALGPHKALLVLAFNNGHVENRLVELPNDTGLIEIGAANELLSQCTHGLTVRQLSKIRTPASMGSPLLDKLAATLFSSLRQLGKDLSQGKLIMEGEEYMLAQPELRQSEEVMREVLENIEDESTMANVVGGHQEHPLMITIGKEHELAGMRHMTVIRHQYTIGGEEAGTLAIVGPTRQDYDRNIAILKFAARAISETFSKPITE